MRKSRIAALALAGCLTALMGKKIESEVPPATTVSRILIDKSDRRLYVYQGSTIINEYPASFGAGELLTYHPKTQQGDKRTPEGTYRIMDKHPSQKFGYFLGLDYPNAEDAKRGLDKGLITNHEYQRILNSRAQDTPLGGAIGIHGEKHLDLISLGPWVNWTRGCISLKDEDIAELYERTKIGTEVTIRK